MRYFLLIFLPLFFFLGVLFFVLPTPVVLAQCVVNNRAQGLISSQTAPVNFGNSNGGIGNCVTGNQAILPVFQIPTFSDLKGQYFDQFNTSANPGTQKNEILRNGVDSDITTKIATANSVNYVQGDFTVSTGVNDPVHTNTAIFFVEGNLNINANIVYPNGGLVFVVNGETDIAKPVTRIDAVIIDAGNSTNLWTICTAYEVGCPDPHINIANFTDPTTTSQLVVNGSFISLNASKNIIFRRALVDNSTAAELVNEQPKYFVLLRNILSQTVTINTEGTDYSLLLGTSLAP